MVFHTVPTVPCGSPVRFLVLPLKNRRRWEYILLSGGAVVVAEVLTPESMKSGTLAGQVSVGHGQVSLTQKSSV